jgi:hypothetical protein
MAVPALGIVEIAGLLILEGVQLFDNERQRAISKKYHNAITYLNEVKNRTFNSEIQYTDIDVKLARQELEAFVIAYAPLLGDEIGNIVKAGVWPPKPQ